MGKTFGLCLGYWFDHFDGPTKMIYRIFFWWCSCVSVLFWSIKWLKVLRHMGPMQCFFPLLKMNRHSQDWPQILVCPLAISVKIVLRLILKVFIRFRFDCLYASLKFSGKNPPDFFLSCVKRIFMGFRMSVFHIQLWYCVPLQFFELDCLSELVSVYRKTVSNRPFRYSIIWFI